MYTDQAEFQSPDSPRPQFHNLRGFSILCQINLDAIPPAFALIIILSVHEYKVVKVHARQVSSRIKEVFEQLPSDCNQW